MEWGEVFAWLAFALAVWFMLAIPLSIAVGRHFREQQPPEVARESNSLCDDSY